MSNGWTAQQIQAPYRMAYGGFPSDIGGLDEAMRQYAQAGINVVQTNPWWERPEEWKQALSQTAQQYQVGIMPWGLFDPSQREQLVSQWSQDPATFGWYMWDEPGTSRTPEGMRETYSQMKGYMGELDLPLMSIYETPVWGGNVGPGITDIYGYEVSYPYGSTDISDPLAWTTSRAGLYGGVAQQAHEAGMDIVPVLQGFLGAGGTAVPNPYEQYGAYEEAYPNIPFSGYNIYTGGAPTLTGATNPELLGYAQQLSEMLGGTLWKGGETMADQWYQWPQYNMYPPPPYGLSGEAYGQDPSQERFPWTRAYYPQATGYGGQEWPSAPLYRPYDRAPPYYGAERYQGMQVPGTFFEGVGTPSLEAYMAGQLGQYPTYGGFEGALAQPTQQTIADLLGGVGVGIPYEAEQYQTAMGRITQAERGAQEELTRLSARGGRIESGLYGAQQQEITETGLEARRQTAQDFAIRTAEMQQEAKQAAVPMALAEMQFGAGQAQVVQESRERAWGAETSDLFQEYQSKLQTATTDYEMRTAQNEMVQSGQERAWQAANDEYTKQYESAKEAGLAEYEAKQQAWQAAMQQYQIMYQSITQAAQQELNIVLQSRAWSEARYLASKGVQAQRAEFWTSGLTGMLGSFLGGL